MIWVIILLIFLSICIWLLLSPFIIEVDTRIPQVGIRWISIGKMRIWYEDEWWLSFRIFFYTKKIRVAAIKRKAKKKDDAAKTRRRKTRFISLLQKMIRISKTFRVQEWQLAVDTGDFTLNARLYPVNYLPYTHTHLHINFSDENYFILKMKNQPWKIALAYLQ